MGLGNRIYTLRSGLGMSQGVLAEKLGVSRQAVSKWENDSAVPELEKLLLLAEVFGVTLDQLAAGETVRDAPARVQAASGLTVPLSSSRLMGVVIICVSLAGIFLRDAYTYGWMHRILLPGMICGLLCLCTRKKEALWCGWAVYLTVDAAICYDEWTGWWELFELRNGVYGIQRFSIEPWLQLAGMLAVLAGTAWHFRREPVRLPARLRRGLAAAAWMAAAVLSLCGWFHMCVWVDTGLAGRLGVCAAGLALAVTFAPAARGPSAAAALGGRIGELRAANRLSQDDLAEKLDISRQAVSKWETGSAVPTLDKLLAISRQFGVSLEWLVREHQPSAPAPTFLSAGQLAGAGLMLMGACVLILRITDFGCDLGLLLPLLLLAGGTLCLRWPRYTGGWGTWTAGLAFCGLLRHNAPTQGIRILLARPAGMDGMDWKACLLELAVGILLLLLTLYSFRRMVLPQTRCGRRGLAAGWGLWAAQEALNWLWVYPGTRPRLRSYLNAHINFGFLADSLSLITLAAVLTLTAAAYRSRRTQKPPDKAKPEGR